MKLKKHAEQIVFNTNLTAEHTELPVFYLF